MYNHIKILSSIFWFVNCRRSLKKAELPVPSPGRSNFAQIRLKSAKFLLKTLIIIGIPSNKIN